MKTLYRKNSFGIGRWCIWKHDFNTIKFGHSMSLTGQLVEGEEIIPEGKGGRTLAEQVKSRIDSRIGKMLDKGYKETMDEAAAATTNQLGLVTPMLAKPLKKNRIPECIIQPKYNGHRCLTTVAEGSTVHYSRQGKIIDTITHITDHIREHLPKGVTLDGELYVHGERLQTIASWVKRKQKATGNLVYYVYDCYIEDQPYMWYGERLKELMKILRPMGQSDHVRLAESIAVSNLDEAMDIYASHTKQGFEGSILRDVKSRYEIGKRSAGLMKLKPVYDTEVEVLDIVPGDSGLGVCIVRMDGLNRSFKVLAPGTHFEKIEALENKKKYIGRRLKIEYRELTNDGVPFHAAAIEWFITILLLWYYLSKM